MTTTKEPLKDCWKMGLDELRHFRVRDTVLFTAAWAEGTHPKAGHVKPLLVLYFHRHTLVLGPNHR